MGLGKIQSYQRFTDFQMSSFIYSKMYPINRTVKVLKSKGSDNKDFKFERES